MPHPAPPRLALLALLALALWPLASCGDVPADSFDDPACAALLNDPESADAYDWLKAPAPAPRRPGSMTVDDALALAHQFEARGAGGLIAVGNRKVEPGAGGSPYFASRGVVVRLPDDPARRLQVFRLYAQQVRNNGYTPRADAGQKLLFIPWTLDRMNP